MINNIITPPGEPAGAALHCQPSAPRRILVVDDEPDICRLNAEVLESSGYQVDTAEDGMAGWEALHATRHFPESYVLLITDHDMPGLTGLALVKKLRAAHMALPVIMATGKLPAEDLMNRYPWLQPVATLIKPYTTEQLLGTVEAVLRTTDGSREQLAPLSNQLSGLTLECLERFVVGRDRAMPEIQKVIPDEQWSFNGGDAKSIPPHFGGCG